MRVVKIAALVITVIFVLVGSTLALLLSPFGQEKVANYILGKLHEQVALPLSFEQFTYTLKSFSVVLRDERGSRLGLNGTYTFLGTVDAEYQIEIAELHPYRALLPMPLHGSLDVRGRAKRTAQGIDINGALKAFESHIDFIASLNLQSQLHKLVIQSDSIAIPKLLTFLGQPMYATGTAMANIDIDFSLPERPAVLFAFQSKDLVVNSPLLQQQYQVKIPANSPLVVQIKGATEGRKLNVFPEIRSSFLTVKSPGIAVEVSSGLMEGELAMVLQNIQYNQWKLPAKTEVNATLSTENGVQNGVIVSDIFQGMSRVEASFPAGKPAELDTVTFDMKDLDIAPLLELASYRQVASGRVDATGRISGLARGSIRSNILARSTHLTINQKGMNEQFGTTLEKKQICTLDASITFANGAGTAQVEVKNRHWRIAAPSIEIDLQLPRIVTPFHIDISDLAAAGLLASPQLQGAISLRGTVVHEKGKLAVEANTESLGGALQLTLKEERVKVKGAAVEAAKIGHLLRAQEIVRAGLIDIDIDLAVVGANAKEIQAALDGSALIKMQGLQLVSINVDKVIQSYENSHKINLVDVGAFVLAGPLGTAVTKGFDFGSLAANTLMKGSTVIDILHADIPFTKGYGTLRDVAFATPKNRVAFTGGFDFRAQQFDVVSIAVLNHKGCATFEQKVEGAFDNPKIEAGRSLIGVAANLVDSIFTGLRDVIPQARTECTVFYKGSVEHPSGSKR